MQFAFARAVREVLDAAFGCWHVALACGRTSPASREQALENNRE